MFDVVTKRLVIPRVLKTQDVKIRRDLRDMSFLYLSLAVAFVVVVVFFVYLWSRLTVVNLGYEISMANARKAELIEENRRLRVEYMELSSLERIERIASTELGLTYPTGKQIINIE